jgi:hypothetical protein
VVVVASTFASERAFVQNSLSIKSHFVIAEIFPQTTDPKPQRLVLLVPPLRHAMAIGSFELKKLFAACVSLLVMFHHGSQKALFNQKDKSGWTWDRKEEKGCCRQRQLKVSLAQTKRK